MVLLGWASNSTAGGPADAHLTRITAAVEASAASDAAERREALLALSLLHARYGRSARALELAFRVDGQPPDDGILLDILQRLMQSDQMAAVSREAPKLGAARHRYASYVALANAQVVRKRRAEALEALAAAEKAFHQIDFAAAYGRDSHHANRVGSIRGLALLHADLGQREQGELWLGRLRKAVSEALTELTAEHGSDAPAHTHVDAIGEVLAALGRHEEARVEFASALEAYGRVSDPSIRLLGVLTVMAATRHAGLVDEAHAALETATAIQRSAPAQGARDLGYSTRAARLAFAQASMGEAALALASIGSIPAELRIGDVQRLVTRLILSDLDREAAAVLDLCANDPGCPGGDDRTYWMPATRGVISGRLGAIAEARGHIDRAIAAARANRRHDAFQVEVWGELALAIDRSRLGDEGAEPTAVVWEEITHLIERPRAGARAASHHELFRLFEHWRNESPYR